MTQAFPLQWPEHLPRTPEDDRTWGSFQVTPDKATRDLLNEVRLSGGADLVISSDRPVRKGGLPRAGAREPNDPGVAVYFTRKGDTVCVACDTFDQVWKNIRAIGLSIRDMRGPESRGCSRLTDQAFRGFTALPPPSADFVAPAAAHRSWWEVLGVARDAPWSVVKGAHRALALEAGGGTAEINAAMEAARKDRGVT